MAEGNCRSCRAGGRARPGCRRDRAGRAIRSRRRRRGARPVRARSQCRLPRALGDVVERILDQEAEVGRSGDGTERIWLDLRAGLVQSAAAARSAVHGDRRRTSRCACPGARRRRCSHRCSRRSGRGDHSVATRTLTTLPRLARRHGADGDRTHDLSAASAALSQLSYGPAEAESTREPPAPGQTTWRWGTCPHSCSRR